MSASEMGEGGHKGPTVDYKAKKLWGCENGTETVVNRTAAHVWKALTEWTLEVSTHRRKKCVTMYSCGDSFTYHTVTRGGDHFIICSYIESLCCTPETINNDRSIIPQFK